MTTDSANPTDPVPQADPAPPVVAQQALPQVPISPLVSPSAASRPGRVGFSSQGTLAVALVMAYLGLGLALAWGIQQSRQRQIAQDRSARERLAADLIVSQEDDLGRFLAQRGTESISLVGMSAGPGSSATVAWNKELRDGRLFCDGLEKLFPPRTCQLWFAGPAGYICVTKFDPIPGQDIYSFHVDGQITEPTEVVLTHGTPADNFDRVGTADVLGRGSRLVKATN